MKTLLLVGLGGALGSILRYLTFLLVSSRISGTLFPYGTFAVNFLGCLLIGVVYGLAGRYGWLTPNIRAFLAIGLCGGYTTFSAFAFENISLLQHSSYGVAFAYIAISVVLCLAAVLLGLFLVEIL